MHRQVCKTALASSGSADPVGGSFSEHYYSAGRKIHSQNVKADVKTNHVPSGKAAKNYKEMASDELPLLPN